MNNFIIIPTIELIYRGFMPELHTILIRTARQAGHLALLRKEETHKILV
jgi:hypothetical protein